MTNKEARYLSEGDIVYKNDDINYENPLTVRRGNDGIWDVDNNDDDMEVDCVEGVFEAWELMIKY
jgi:hypothetical protein